MSTTPAQDLTEVLRDHHDRVEQMMRAVKATSGHDRVVVFSRLRRFLAAHEAAEAVFIHAPARHLLEESEVAHQRLAEEEQAAGLITRLEALDVDSGEFDRLFDELVRSVAVHARAEELQELPEVVDASTPDDLERMRQALEHVNLVASQRHGPLGVADPTFEAMLESARSEFRSLRSDYDG